MPKKKKKEINLELVQYFENTFALADFAEQYLKDLRRRFFELNTYIISYNNSSNNYIIFFGRKNENGF